MMLTITRPISAAPQPSLRSVVDGLMRRLLAAGLPVGPNVLLTVRGRTSGLPRTVPVAILEHGGRRYVRSRFGEVSWVRNLRTAGEATLSRRRRQEAVEAIELAPEDAASILQNAVAPYLSSPLRRAVVGRFVHIRPDSTLEEYAADAQQHPMFELRSRA